MNKRKGSKFTSIEHVLKGEEGNEIIVREANIKDAPQIINLLKSNLYTSPYLLFYPEEFRQTKKGIKLWIKYLHQQINGLMLIAEYEEEIIKNTKKNNREIIAILDIAGSKNLKTFHTANVGIGIKEKWRNRGVGSFIFYDAIQWAKKNLVLELLCLQVYKENEAGIKLYEKLGFIKQGIIKNYFKNKKGEYSDQLIMSLNVR